jgi:isopenicillin-N epimerase
VAQPRLKLPAPSEFRPHWALATRTVFLNHGSFGACPKPILRLQSEFRRRMEAEPVQFLWRRYEDWLEPSRAGVAHFVGAKPRDLVFVANATTAVNSVVRSLPLRRGDEILTTDLDYNACHNALAETAARAGARLVTARIPVPLESADQVHEAVLKAVTPRTRLAMIDHVTSNTALVFPVERIIRELESRGVDTLVDGAHAPGMLSLDMDKLSPSYYTGNLHKWVCAPKGAAFLWVRPDRQEGLNPAVVSHGNNTPRPGFTPFQDRFDWCGTIDPSPWFCAGESILWMGRLLPGGWNELRERNRKLTLQARSLFSKHWRVEPLCPDSMVGSIATIALPERFQSLGRTGKIDAEQLALYDRFRVEVPFVRFGRPERRYLRVSAQIYNTLADYEYLAAALELL